MGTLASLALGERESTPIETAVSIATGVLVRIEAELSVYRPGSAIRRLNAAAGSGSNTVLSAEARDVLAKALQFAEASGGAFDPTVGPLMRLWGFGGGGDPVAVPSDALRAQTLAGIGYRDILVEADGARLARVGGALDLGGIAKGFAVDRCWDALRVAGARDFLVNVGGNMRASGMPRRGDPWRVGVRDPFDREAILGALPLADGMALATSGNYERFVMIDGVRYAHIMDARTGQPVTGMAGVTVLAPSACDTDGLSTSLFVLGVEAGCELLGRFPGAEALFVPDEHPARLLATPGFADLFEPLPAYRDAVVRIPGRALRPASHPD